MTRKEFEETLYKELNYIKERCYPNDKYSIFEPTFIQSMEWLYSSLNKEFESRTCENCIHYKDKVIDYNDITYEGNCNNFTSDVLYVDRYFGCNKFERKEDD